MCHEEHGDALGLVQFMYGFQYFFAAFGVQHGGCLVHEDALRVHGQKSCDGNALFLSAGKLVRGTETVGGQTDAFQCLFHPLFEFFRRHAHIFRAEGHVLFHRGADDLVVRVLENHAGVAADLPDRVGFLRVAPGEEHRAFRREQDRIDVLNHRGFTGTVMAQNRNEITLFHVERDIRKRTDRRDLGLVRAVLGIVV